MELPIRGAHQLIDDSHTTVREVEVLALQPDQLTPPHASVDGQVDERPESFRVGLG